MMILTTKNIKYKTVIYEKGIWITLIKEKVHITTVATMLRYGIFKQHRISKKSSQSGKSHKATGKTIKQKFIIHKIIVIFLVLFSPYIFKHKNSFLPQYAYNLIIHSLLGLHLEQGRYDFFASSADILNEFGFVRISSQSSL